MYDITLDDFTGPMDLLLSLIKEHKMDIMHIKLEIIIDEYLNYINKLQEKNLDIASSYLVMASELLEIKSKMLLPKQDEEEEEEDPKERLINRLIIYQEYKNQVEKFKELESNRSNFYTKIPSSLEEYKDPETKIDFDANIDDLVEAFKKFLERVELEKPVNTKVTKKELSVDDEIKHIKNKLVKNKKINFYELFDVKTKEYIVVTFLAILEMAKKHELRIIQEDNFDNIICEGM